VQPFSQEFPFTVRCPPNAARYLPAVNLGNLRLNFSPYLGDFVADNKFQSKAHIGKKLSHIFMQFLTVSILFSHFSIHFSQFFLLFNRFQTRTCAFGATPDCPSPPF
jgi:hypothetical protein